MGVLGGTGGVLFVCLLVFCFLFVFVVFFCFLFFLFGICLRGYKGVCVCICVNKKKTLKPHVLVSSLISLSRSYQHIAGQDALDGLISTTTKNRAQFEIKHF